MHEEQETIQSNFQSIMGKKEKASSSGKKEKAPSSENKEKALSSENKEMASLYADTACNKDAGITT